MKKFNVNTHKTGSSIPILIPGKFGFPIPMPIPIPAQTPIPQYQHQVLSVSGWKAQVHHVPAALIMDSLCDGQWTTGHSHAYRIEFRDLF